MWLSPSNGYNDCWHFASPHIENRMKMSFFIQKMVASYWVKESFFNSCGKVVNGCWVSEGVILNSQTSFQFEFNLLNSALWYWGFCCAAQLCQLELLEEDCRAGREIKTSSFLLVPVCFLFLSDSYPAMAICFRAAIECCLKFLQYSFTGFLRDTSSSQLDLLI